jgi:hypothetical protein
MKTELRTSNLPNGKRKWTKLISLDAARDGLPATVLFAVFTNKLWSTTAHKSEQGSDKPELQ